MGAARRESGTVHDARHSWTTVGRTSLAESGALRDPGYGVMPAGAGMPATDQRVNSAEVVIAWIFTVFSAGYFLPWAIAATRGKSNSAAIGLLNFFLGWTLIGWVIPLIHGVRRSPSDDGRAGGVDQSLSAATICVALRLLQPAAGGAAAGQASAASRCGVAVSDHGSRRRC